MGPALLLAHEYMRDPVLCAAVVAKELRAGQVEETPIHKPFQSRSLAIGRLQSPALIVFAWLHSSDGTFPNLFDSFRQGVSFDDALLP